jgi:protein-disulfide isomerase-like protein with CxxC motif
MKNSFEGGSQKEEYTPDVEVLEGLMPEAKRIAEATGQDVSETDIRGAVIRAMRAADRAGDPFTKADISSADSALEEKLQKALAVQMDMKNPGRDLLIDDASGTVLGSVSSSAEAGRMAQEHQENREQPNSFQPAIEKGRP